MNNHFWKRFTSIGLALLMVLSLAACHKTTDVTEETTATAETQEAQETEAEDTASASEITVNFHYYREDGVYDGWNVWLWIDNGSAYYFDDGVDDNGVSLTATFPAGTQSIGYIVRLNEWEKKDIEADQFIDTSSILAGTVDVYVVSGVEGCTMILGDDCVTGLGLKSAAMTTDYQSINVTLTADWEEGNSLTVTDKKNATVEVTSLTADGSKVVLTLSERADEMGTYTVTLNGSMSVEVSMPDYFSSDDFEAAYTYDGDDLGAVYTKEQTVFKVWAPTAEGLTLNLYQSGDASASDLIEAIEMTAEDKGVWSATVSGDQNGVYYTYTADFGTYKNADICDPYAKAVGVNGNRAMVIDLDATDPEGWAEDSNPNAGLEVTDAIIYETSIRDTTMDESSGVTAKGQYLGMIERGTTNANGDATGLDHIVSLGITHVQIMPSYDFATVDETKDITDQYNWGYDPKNYNVPEGSYSSDPTDGAVRVKEYKQMVAGLHAAGLSVNMDVVYNHTYNTSYCFNQLVPGYFYRTDSNGSGCGNDVASERSMVRKFIVDSVCYWVEEYHLDGFRFDLVGLIDVDTMNAIREAVDEINPDVMLYGEGWTLSTNISKAGTKLATQSNVSSLNGVALFNDEIRDTLKGSVFNSTEKGYVNNGGTSGASVVAKTLTGVSKWTSDPTAMVNYTSCHDNMTLWDEINSSNASDSLEDRISQNLLAAGVIYTSQGIPFMLSGEEMLRTKTKSDGSFDSNSYVSGDAVNSLKWDTLADENYQLVLNYYRGLIAFRKAHASLTQTSVADGCYTAIETGNSSVIAYEVAPADGETANGIVLIYNPTTEAVEITLPEGEWTINIAGTKAGCASLGTASGTITVEPISMVALTR